jgi:hypothetical protein
MKIRTPFISFHAGILTLRSEMDLGGALSVRVEILRCIVLDAWLLTFIYTFIDILENRNEARFYWQLPPGHLSGKPRMKAAFTLKTQRRH